MTCRVVAQVFNRDVGDDEARAALTLTTECKGLRQGAATLGPTRPTVCGPAPGLVMMGDSQSKYWATLFSQRRPAPRDFRAVLLAVVDNHGPL